jgi:hypothetical protein
VNLAHWCKCGHGLPAHLHNREGTDCGICPDCPRFRRAWLATLAGPPTPKDRTR